MPETPKPTDFKVDQFVWWLRTDSITKHVSRVPGRIYKIGAKSVHVQVLIGDRLMRRAVKPDRVIVR